MKYIMESNDDRIEITVNKDKSVNMALYTPLGGEFVGGDIKTSLEELKLLVKILELECEE